MENDQKWPKRYRLEFIEPGIISYEDIDQGKVFVSNEALDRMSKSYIGKPVVNFLHEDLTPEQAFKNGDDLESRADGVVYDVGKTDNGWHYCDAIIWDDETQQNISEKGFLESCAYTVDEVGPSGQYHGIDYDEEVVNGTYTHMAIVNNPRYERSKIYELPSSYENAIADQITRVFENSKKENDYMSNIFKLIFNSKKKENQTPPEKDPKEPEEKGINRAEDSVVEMENGEQVPLAELVAAYLDGEDSETGSGTVMNMDDMVDVDGEQVPVKDLYAAYQASQSNQNAELPQDTVAEPMVKENSIVPKTPVVEEKPNKHFTVIKNAAITGQGVDPELNTRTERLKRGRDKYTLGGEK